MRISRFDILHRDGHRCAYCGATAEAARLHVDHIVPIADGGLDTTGNLVTACAQCNGSKSSKALHPTPTTALVTKRNLALGWRDDAPVRLKGTASRRDDGRPAQARRRVTRDEYDRLVDGADTRMHVAIGLAWFGRLRSSELAAIARSSVRFVAGGAAVHVCRFPQGHRVPAGGVDDIVVVAARGGRGKALCAALRTWVKLLDARGYPRSGALLVGVTKSGSLLWNAQGHASVSAQAIRHAMTRRARDVGLAVTLEGLRLSADARDTTRPRLQDHCNAQLPLGL